MNVRQLIQTSEETQSSIFYDSLHGRKIDAVQLCHITLRLKVPYKLMAMYVRTQTRIVYYCATF